MKPATTAAARPASDVRVNLAMPVTRVGFGPFSFDPVEQMIGAPLTDILESLMTGPVYRRPSLAGPAVDVYPLALPDGEGATIPLAQFGEIGFRNLCFAGHKLAYAESASMRSWRPTRPCRRGSSAQVAPHNDAPISSGAVAGGGHA